MKAILNIDVLISVQIPSIPQDAEEECSPSRDSGKDGARAQTGDCQTTADSRREDSKDERALRRLHSLHFDSEGQHTWQY